ncbi:hypothetical protein CDAR_226391 [Caerostris darwini]|uniref:Uncharacterized protein n=1 Tax=Caerostris darwini TaxID=1538125 RepID=A0AAV4MM02_9ARAC|nr:hypothetical protein CDAR_226391 [Caerostris darwini]
MDFSFLKKHTRETQLQAAKFKDGAIFGLIKEYKQRIYTHNYNFGVKSAVSLHKGYCSCYDPSKSDHFLFSHWLKSQFSLSLQPCYDPSELGHLLFNRWQKSRYCYFVILMCQCKDIKDLLPYGSFPWPTYFTTIIENHQLVTPSSNEGPEDGQLDYDS